MSSDNPPPPPDVWQSKNMDQADMGLYSKVQGFGNQPNYAAMEYARAQPAFAGVFGAQPGTARGETMAGWGQNMAGYGNQALQTGFDPQNDLYGRTAQRLQEQVRAGQTARGVEMTPYGAALENQAMSDFNMDWADRALGRQQQGANTAATLYGQGGQLTSAGTQMQQNVPSWQMQMLQGLQGAGSNTYAFPQQEMDNYLRYMQMGMGGDQNAMGRYSNELKAYEMQQAQDAALWQALGSLGGSAMSMAMNPASAFGMKLWG